MILPRGRPSAPDISRVSIVPDAPTDGATDEQNVVVEHEARSCRREPGKGVQKRDDDGHVRSADGDDERHAQKKRGGHHDDYGGHRRDEGQYGSTGECTGRQHKDAYE
jgi:hypothetical protein